MCLHWGVKEYVFNDRIKDGWTLEEALEGKNPNTAVDHLGKKYDTLKEMCAYWGMKSYIFKDRIKDGWSLEEALTIPYRLQ
ncbi:hypothetical protein [Acetobacterium carbinolicum]|uniref:hypothetical protein n=1 Tax=Acetobacterium carbinolicum TaxID=52690 RepID=UPI0039C91758